MVAQASHTKLAQFLQLILMLMLLTSVSPSVLRLEHLPGEASNSLGAWDKLPSESGSPGVSPAGESSSGVPCLCGAVSCKRSVTKAHPQQEAGAMQQVPTPSSH